MKHSRLIFYLSVFIFWSCELNQPKNIDATLPIISLTSHQSGDFVSEISIIKISATENLNINKVEFYVDDSLHFIDLESPYQFSWNTTDYLDSSEHVIKAIYYNSSGDYAETEPIVLFINNSSFKPIPSQIYKILYYEDFLIKWSMNNDNDFLSYKLYKSLFENMNDKILIFETTEINDTTYLLNDADNNEFYQIESQDIYGLSSLSNIEPLFVQVELWGEYYSVKATTELILVNNGLIGSIPSTIGNLTNLNTLVLGGNDLSGSIPNEIGNLTNLQNLNLQSNQLSGQIPLEIGNLINLNELSFSSNQLSGIIPNEICNQGDTSPDLSNNHLCPPYPDCIEVDIENQELANCNDVVELWGEYYSIDYTTEINLPSEGLMGEIPSEIGNLVSLQNLNLYNNELSGHIPSELGNLTNLTSLVLWANQLEGEIPPELGNLTN